MDWRIYLLSILHLGELPVSTNIACRLLQEYPKAETRYSLYALRTTPEHDGVSTFTWTSVSSTSGGSNVGARVGNIFISFRLDANNDVLIGSSTFSSTPSQNPVWLFVSKAPVAISGPAALSAEVERMVTATNDFRAEYGAGALTYNPTIASFAQTVADTCVFEHSDGNGGMYGENLVYGGYSFDSVNAVNAWGPEEAGESVVWWLVRAVMAVVMGSIT